MQQTFLVIILFAVNYFAVGLVRAEIRSQHINKYHYDYYDQHPKASGEKLWHNFKSVIFEGLTVVTSVILSVVETYFFVF